jgi:hypothetical protein
LKPQCLAYEYSLKNLTVALEDEGFTTKIVEYLKDVYHTQYQEPSDIEGEIYEENCQPLEEEQHFSHDSIECIKDLTRKVNYEDEALVTTPPSDEALQDPISPAKYEENEVIHFHLQYLDDTLFYDSEGEEVKEPLEELVPSFFDEDEEMSLDDDILNPLPFGEAIQAIDAPSQQEVNMESYFPFQYFDDALFYDLESEEVPEEPLDALNPLCYDKASDIVDNIDEFIHVGRCKLDVIGSNEYPIYDTEGYFQMFHLQLSSEVTNDCDSWQQGNDIVTDISKGALVLFSSYDFRSYLEYFYEYSLEHLDLFYEEYYQPPLYSDIDRGEDIACPNHGTCDNIIHPPLIALPSCVTKGVVGKHVPCVEFSPRQSLPLEFKDRLNTLRRSLLYHSFDFPLEICPSFSSFLLVLYQTSGYDDVQGSPLLDPLSQSFEPFIFHDPFLRWIEHFPKNVN